MIICSNEEEDKSYFISKLHLYRRPFVFQTSTKELEDYLLDHFTKQVQKAKKPSYDFTNMASVVDSLKYDIALTCMLWVCNYDIFCSSCVRVVSSDRSGMGKSLYIKFLAEKLAEKQPNSGVVHVTIPLHGPVVSPDTVLELFKDHLEKPSCCIYHIDIAPSVWLGSFCGGYLQMTLQYSNVP